MKLTNYMVFTFAAAGLGAAPMALAKAGFIQFVSGEARIVLAAGGERAAQKGVELNEGDTVITGRETTVQLRMVDDGLIAVRPDSQLRIDVYQYAGREDGNERGALALVRGSFRTLTGIIGRTNKRNYLVRTPSATIGIRGTDHEVVFIPTPAPGETALGTPGTYNKVNVGETYIESQGGRLELGANQVGFSGLTPGAAPTRLDTVPPFMRGTSIQQGRDNRRQERVNPGEDQKRIAQRQQGQPGQGTTSGPQGGGPRTVPGGGTQQQPLAPLNQQQPLAPLNQQQPLLPQNFAGEGGSLTAATQGLAPAPDRHVGVGGDLSFNGVSGSGVVMHNVSGNIFFGQDGQISVVSRPVNGFSYTRAGAHNIAPGQVDLVDGAGLVPVRWGVYAGGTIVDSSGSRAVQFFHFMNAQGTPLAVANTLTGTYTTVVAQNKLITESGVLGGSVTSANVTITAGNVTNYNVTATDAQARNWTGNCPTCTGGISLTQFASNGVNITGTGPGGAANGKAAGAPIGPSGKAVVTSFNLSTTTGKSVTGSFAVK